MLTLTYDPSLTFKSVNWVNWKHTVFGFLTDFNVQQFICLSVCDTSGFIAFLSKLFITLTYIFANAFMMLISSHQILLYRFSVAEHPFCCSVTVGQRKKVTAVTFFPARPRLDQTAQIRAKYTKFPLMKSRDFWCIEWMWLYLSWVQIPGSQCAWFGRYGFFWGDMVFCCFLSFHGEGGNSASWRR